MLTLLSDSQWALQRTSLEHLIEQSRLDAGSRDVVAARSRTPAGRVLSVAVLPIVGLIFPRGTPFLTELFGASSLEALGRELRALAADESVRAIVLDMDSPGGLVRA